MSAYITLATPMTERQSLLDALADLGFTADEVEVHDEPTALVGYEGARRGQKAHIVIRKRHVGRSSNDIGFLATPTGYRAFISDYDQSRYGQAWLAKLANRYQHHHNAMMERMAEEERRRKEEERRALVEAQRQEISEKARKMGYQVQETREGDKIRLVLLRRTY